MSQINIPPKLWFENILLAIKNFYHSAAGFAVYENGRLYTMYTNYLDYAYMFLDDMLFHEFIKNNRALIYGVPRRLFNLLIAFNNKVEAFFQLSGELSDFEVIRYKEWDEIMPLAKECYEGLKKIYDKMPDEPEK